MNRNKARTLLIVSVAAFLVGMAATAQAKGKEPQCTSAGVAGEWGYTYTGMVILPTGAAVPVASVGTFTLDAAGNFVGSQTRSTGGGGPASQFGSRGKTDTGQTPVIDLPMDSRESAGHGHCRAKV